MLTPLTDGDPRSVGPYRLQNRIGSGGMGTVYLGFTEGERAVAVKVASAELAEDSEFRIRFRREVRAAQRVRGKAVASVLDADTEAYQPWMVTEYVDGVSLTDAVRTRGRLEQHLVRGLAVGLADGLVAIHGAGVIHRDLKPSNILLAWDGPKVIDFGIAHLTDSEGLTRTGTVIGTLAWMAPEQMRGDPVTQAADVFAWATCVVFAATGRHPFHADTAEQLARRVQSDPPDIFGLPDYLAGLVPRALSKHPHGRPCATELMAELLGREVRGVGDADDATGAVLEQTWTGPSPASFVSQPQPQPQPQSQPPQPQPQQQPQPSQPPVPAQFSVAASRRPAREQQLVRKEPPQQPGSPGPSAPPPVLPDYPHPGSASRQPSADAAPRLWNMCAVLSLVFGVTWVLGIGSVLAVILGYVGRSQARTRGERGATVATVGIALGWIGIVLTTLGVIAVSAATTSLRNG